MTSDLFERDSGPRSVPAGHLAWLDRELAGWQEQGRIDAATAAGIRGKYTASRRFSLGRLLLALGGAFVGVGLLWLVAANLDQLSPPARFVGVTVLWLACVAAAEVLSARRHEDGSAVVGAVRLVAALAFGAVVFQAAQSLQVPAYDPGLVGIWGAGALLYAYAAGAVAPLVVGVLASVGWFVWVVAQRTESVAGTALALLLASVLATAVAVAHDGRWQPGFAPPWRAAAVLLCLVGLFVATFSPSQDDRNVVFWASGAVVLAAAVAAAIAADRTGRLEVGAVVTATLLGLLLLGWQPPGPTSAAELTGEGLLRAGTSILVYLLAAIWFAALGVLRDAKALTSLATAGLVLFTVVQSFAVIEPILSGATLFLVLGAVLAATGYLVDRGRRRLVAGVNEVAA